MKARVCVSISPFERVSKGLRDGGPGLTLGASVQARAWSTSA